MEEAVGIQFPSWNNGMRRIGLNETWNGGPFFFFLIISPTSYTTKPRTYRELLNVKGYIKNIIKERGQLKKMN